MTADSPSVHRVASRFELLRKLGEGGMGVVYEAYDHVRQARVALKTIRNANPKSLYRLKREFRALCDIVHPNVISLYELIADGDQWLLAMEVLQGLDFLAYVRDGRELPDADDDATSNYEAPTATFAPEAGPITPLGRAYADDEEDITRNIRLGRRSRRQERVETEVSVRPMLGDIVDLDRLYRAMIQLARGLRAIHAAGLVHRDLKPSNVMVTGDDRVVLMDFGVVAELKQPRHAGEHRIILGTPAYMAPEQVRGERPSAAADWYAFGVLLYHALTGKLPYEGSSREIMVAKLMPAAELLMPGALVTGLDDSLDRLCMQLLAHDPGERPSYDAIVHGLMTLSPGGACRAAASKALDADADRQTGVEEPVFTGRAAEMSWLRNHYDAAAAHGACAIIRGLSGMGKTALVDRFVVEARAVDDAVVLSGRCHERESIAYKAFDGVIDDLAGYLVGLPPERRDALLHAELGALARLFPALGQVPGLTMIAGTWHAYVGELRPRAVAALRRMLAALATQSPVIVRIEDLHWADCDSLYLLAELAEEQIPAGVMLLCTVREEALSANPTCDLSTKLALLCDRGIAKELSLGPLSPVEQRELVSRVAIVAGAQVPAGSGDYHHSPDEIYRDAEGHPMLLLELVRSVFRPDGPAAGTGSGGLHSLEEILWRRVAALPRAARLLIEIIAIAGGPMPLRVLAEAGELGGEETQRAISVLLVQRLVRTAWQAEEPWLQSYHHKVGEAVRSHLSPQRLRDCHRRLARSLTAWGQAPAATLARHWALAGEGQTAAERWIEAAAEAAEKLAPSYAAELYRYALACLPAEPAASLPRQLALLCCQAELGLIQALRVIERVDEALAHVARAEELALHHNFVAELPPIYYLRGSLLFVRGDVEGCMLAHSQALRYAQAAGSIRDEAYALSGLGDAYVMRCRIHAALVEYSRCHALCQALGFAELAAPNLSMIGFCQYFLNENQTARHSLLGALELARRIGNRRAEIVASTACSMVLLDMGEHALVSSISERSLRLASEIGSERHRPLAYSAQARALLLVGRRDEARALLTGAVTSFPAVAMAFGGAAVLSVLALTEDDASRAWALFAQAEEVLKSRPRSQAWLFIMRDGMHLGLQFGNRDAVEHYAALMEQATQMEPLPWVKLMVARARVLARVRSGHADAGTRAELRRVYDEVARVGLHTPAAALAEALAQLGETTRR